jgi:hypothetical protein
VSVKVVVKVQVLLVKVIVGQGQLRQGRRLGRGGRSSR